MHINDLINNNRECYKKRKLPKGWNYKTKLVNHVYECDDKEEDIVRNTVIENKKGILDLYNKGILVKSSNVFDGYIGTNIDKDGWNMIIEYNERYGIHFKIIRGCFTTDKLFSEYYDARQALDDEKAELERMSNLSDEEWSKEQIDKTFNRYKKIYGIDDNTIQKFREYLFNKKDIEDIEVRIHFSKIQWKYWDKKKWNDLTLEVI